MVKHPNLPAKMAEVADRNQDQEAEVDRDQQDANLIMPITQLVQDREEDLEVEDDRVPIMREVIKL